MTEEDRQEVTAIIQREILAILDDADNHIIVDSGNDLGTIAKATVRHLAATIRDRATKMSSHHTTHRR